VKKSRVWRFAIGITRADRDVLQKLFLSEEFEYFYLLLALYTMYIHTQRGRSRAQHVRDREADVEGAKNWRLVHLRRSKGEARRAEPTSPFLLTSDQKRQIWVIVVSP